MVKIAAHGAISWETIQEWDPFVQYFQVEMPLQVVQVENEELLYGTGTGHFAGFFSTSAILRHNVAGATDTTALDAIEQAIEQTRSGPALAEPDLFITSPSSWSALRRIKDDLHRYILSPDPTREEANQLRGVPVLVTTQCNPGDGLLIDTTKFGKALVREGLVMRQGTNRDDFSRNLMRWVVELRGNLAVERPPAVLARANLPTTVPRDRCLGHAGGSGQACGLTHGNCPRNALGASLKNARETVTVVRHGEWVIDVVSCRDHHQVRQGVCAGREEGQGQGPRPGGGGDWVVARQCPAQAYRSGDAAAGIGSQ